MGVKKEAIDYRKLALDIVEGRVFGSWMVDNLTQETLGMIFMPLALAGPKEIEAIMEAKPAAFYEYLDKAGPRAVNGYPIFFSCRTLSGDELAELAPLVHELNKKRQEFLARYEVSEDGKSIKCLTCGMTSHHPEDVKNKYCGKCNKFHEGNTNG